MSVKIMSRVFDTTFKPLSFDDNGVETTLSPSTVKIVMLAVADSSDDEGDNSYNGVNRLVTKTNLSERSVVRAIRALVNAGYLYKHDERSRLGTNSYQINLSMLEYDLKRPKTKLGRPTKEKVSDSTPKVSDSTPKVSDSTRSDPSLSIPIHPIEPQQILQTQPSLPAKETPIMATVEEHKRRTEEALFASLINANKGYTHEYPEDVRPVIERMEARWNLRAPGRPRNGKGKLYAYWVESCRALLDACGEFGVDALDKLRDDFEAYMADHGGVAPHTYSSPNSLVSSMLAKAAQLRGGNTAPLWGSKKPQARQTMLDV